MVSRRWMILALVVVAALTAFMTTRAFAYNPGNQAVYQIGLSLNCQNQTLCQASPQNPFGIGGLWGWIELDQDRTGDAQLTGQGHDNANPLLNGAVHFSLSDLTWSSDGTTLTIAAPDFGVQHLPAIPGHYQQNFGPGMNNNIQVNKLR